MRHTQNLSNDALLTEQILSGLEDTARARRLAEAANPSPFQYKFNSNRVPCATFTEAVALLIQDGDRGTVNRLIDGRYRPIPAYEQRDAVKLMLARIATPRVTRQP